MMFATQNNTKDASSPTLTQWLGLGLYLSMLLMYFIYFFPSSSEAMIVMQKASLPYPMLSVGLSLVGVTWLYFFPNRVYVGALWFAFPALVLLRYGFFAGSLAFSKTSLGVDLSVMGLLLLMMTIQNLLVYKMQKEIPSYLQFYGYAPWLRRTKPLDERQQLEYQTYAAKAYDYLPLIWAAPACAVVYLWPQDAKVYQNLTIGLVLTGVTLQQILPSFLAYCAYVNTDARGRITDEKEEELE